MSRKEHVGGSSQYHGQAQVRGHRRGTNALVGAACGFNRRDASDISVAHGRARGPGSCSRRVGAE